MREEWWSGKDFEGSGYSLIKILFLAFAWKDWGASQKSSVRLVGVLSKYDHSSSGIWAYTAMPSLQFAPVKELMDFYWGILKKLSIR